MTTILDKLAKSARMRTEREKIETTPSEMRQAAEALCLKDEEAGHPLPAACFEAALAKPGLSFICEVKKASPSKGVIAADFPYRKIAREYEAAGADAISVLTEPEYFLGSLAYLAEIAAAVRVPVLRKDFIIDPYQIDQARVSGASAVLLIAALLGNELGRYIAAAHRAGLCALVEIHDEAEAACAVEAGAAVIGVNNRDLKTFQVDHALSARLRSCVPKEVLFVAESGIRSPEDTRALRALGADAVLIGESLMRAQDKKAALAALKAGAGKNAPAVAQALAGRRGAKQSTEQGA